MVDTFPGVWCFHLADGTLLLAQMADDDDTTRDNIAVVGAFALTKVRTPTAAAAQLVDPVKVVLTKYDSFNNDPDTIITLHKTGVISRYMADEKVSELYYGFLADQIEQLAAMDGPTRGSVPTITDMLAQYLTEDNPISVDEVRKKVRRIRDEDEE